MAYLYVVLPSPSILPLSKPIILLVLAGFHVAPPPVVSSLCSRHFVFIVANYGLCAQPTKAAAPQPPPTQPDPYYGHENTARLCGLHHSPLRMSRVPSYILGLKYQTPAFHHLRSAPDKTTLICDFCIAGLAATTEGSLPYGSRFLGALTVYICFHDRIKGYLRRHLFEQVMEHSRAGDVSAARDQSDGAQDVSIIRLGAQRQTIDAERV